MIFLDENQRKIKMNKLIAIILCFMFTTPAFADGKVSVLKQDQKAPFAGYLFDATAFATIEADKEAIIKKCELDKEFLIKKSSSLMIVNVQSANVLLPANFSSRPK